MLWMGVELGYERRNSSKDAGSGRTDTVVIGVLL